MDEKAECRNDITFWEILDMQPEDYSEKELNQNKCKPWLR